MWAFLTIARRALAIANRNRREDTTVATTTKGDGGKDIEETKADSLSDNYAGPVFVIRRAARTVEPFILSHDLPRGILYALQAFLAYTLMLAVMCVL